MRGAIFCTLAALGSAQAHDLYLMPERFRVSPGESLTIAVHNGDAFPDSEVSAPLERLRGASLRAAQSTAEVRNLHADGKRTLGSVTVPGPGDLLLSLRTVPNFIELAPDKFVDYLKEEGLTQVLAWRSQHGESSKSGRERYSKYAKALLVAGPTNDQYRHPIGFPIEIIPEKDPYQLKAGDSLPVQVLLRGSPAVDLQLEAAWAGPSGHRTQVVGRTDAHGRIAILLTAPGKWRLHALKMERCSDPSAADWESFWASLTFELR